jgi:nitrogen regulatory protein PII
MYFLVNVLEQTDHLPEILESFAQIGIRGSTILNSTGMGRILMQTKADAEVTKGICDVVENCQPSNKTILTVIRDEEALDKAINVVKSFCGDLKEPGKGVLFVLPLHHVEGIPEKD